ncbi:MAG: acVLRF1 family peptidyl-tRNA hydrolase [Ornithinimicrobium sp.]
MREPRRIDVPRDRLQHWVDGFAQRHGAPTWTVDGAGYRATAANGAWATFSSWTPAQSLPPDLLAWSEAPTTFVVILIRRGGYAVGVVHAGELVAHKCGTRYVQSRTAAGGWSQQRYARRRSNQADDLVGVVSDRVAVMIAGTTAGGLVLGGDKTLAHTVTGEFRLQHLAALPKREFFDLPDPRMRVLISVAARSASIAVDVSNGET